MRVEVAARTALRFEDGTPVRAASGVVEYDTGWLVVQDDATHACLLTTPTAAGTPLRLLPPVDGHDSFDEAAGTKHLKPDLEAACAVGPGALILGSGSTPARMRGVLLARPEAEPLTADLSGLYARIGAALAVDPEQLNLEGACRVGTALRWFHRGRPAAGLPSAAIDVPLAALLAAVHGDLDPTAVPLSVPQLLDLGDGLAVTDAVTLDAHTVLVSAALEDSPDAYDDGAVLASALAILVDGRLTDRVLLPELDGRVAKVEGLAVRSTDSTDPTGVRLLATVDADDVDLPSWALDLRLRL
ncbi:hypothetical protein [Nocardioides sp. W7]|uniref:DUF6910 family protein n=1 Tax=Nocardioides sp. W7 TaxID=2931390 RepID=UPI001FD25CA6|nr:hypothetical protein [Nocardioides sp. W7]